MSRKKPGGAAIATNRRARYDYVFEDEYEAGIVLTGSEVKSLRGGQAQIKEAYGLLRDGEIWLVGMHIAPYSMARDGGHEPTRERKLLLHAYEIARISKRVKERGHTLVPIRMYWKNGRAKVLLGVGRGARKYDKRQAIKAREMRREAQQSMSHRRSDRF
ncbi:MAG: SsrA-binding protein SmpB [bacterium]|nr:SsrA-binding protein SmpB [bacterium]